MDKQRFFLFRRKRDNHEGYEYIQHMTSPSHDGGLSLSCWPEFAWRGQTVLDVEKMRYLISISKYYKNKNFELVQYYMDSDTPSWAIMPERIEYENVLTELRPLTQSEIEDLQNYKIKALERYGNR